MIDGVRSAWAGPARFERFSPPPVVGGRPFEVQLGAGGPVVEVAAGESALTALRRVRPDVAYSCGQGFCGACRVRVRSGAVERHGGAPSEQDSMLVCVSRPRAAVSSWTCERKGHDEDRGQPRPPWRG